MRTQGDQDAFVIGQEGALQGCEAKRSGLVDLIDAAQKRPRPWWAFRLPDG